MSDSDDFFDQQDQPEMSAGRYRLPHPETGVEQSWTRATTHARRAEDSFALARWEGRQILRGLQVRPDILRLLQASADPLSDGEIDQHIDSAKAAMQTDAKANDGTAIHEALRRVDRAWNDSPLNPVSLDTWLRDVGVPEWALPHARSYVAELNRHGLRPISSMTERRVVNLALECAGTIDNLYEEADGTIAMGDKKTGRLDRYTERQFAIQLAVYAGADYLLDRDGGPPVDLRSIGLRQDYAVLVDVDPESGTCAVYRIDLRRGQLGANLAADVQSWRRERHLVLPYAAPGVPLAAWQAGTPMPTGPALRAVPDLPRANVITSDDSGTFAVSGGLQDETAARVPSLPNPVTGNPRIPLRTAADLMQPRVTKAEVQQYCREHGITDLAHTKKVLVEMLNAAGKLVAPGANPSRNVSNANDPAELPAGPATAGAEDPTDPKSAAFQRARLAEIQAASSVNAIGAVWSFVKRVGGDQAWTSALAQASKERAAELDAQQSGPRVYDWQGQQLTAEQAVATVESSKQMTELWMLVTTGGSDEAAWTPELNELAHARLAFLDSQPPAAAPVRSPFDPK